LADGTQEFWKHGKRHRENGPAVVPAGKGKRREWWIDGVRVTQKDFPRALAEWKARRGH
jgi:hypothetical protein